MKKPLISEFKKYIGFPKSRNPIVAKIPVLSCVVLFRSIFFLEHISKGAGMLIGRIWVWLKLCLTSKRYQRVIVTSAKLIVLKTFLGKI